MYARRLAAFGLAVALAMASPAAAQKDPFGVGREFGAYLNPSKAADMIRDCDAQNRAVETAIAAYQGVVAEHQRAMQTHQSRLDALHEAQGAVAEAEKQLARASGAEADRIRDTVLEPRRQRYRALADAFPTQNGAFEASYEKTMRTAEATAARLRAAGLSDAEMAGAPAEIVRRQSERCKRMRAWAALGRAAQLPSPSQPSPESLTWPEGARALWTGQWSCQRESTAGGQTIRVAISAKLSASLRQDGALRSNLVTDSTYGREAGWGSTRSIRLFSPLEVSRSEPRRAAFANRDELDEDRVDVDAIDSATMSADGSAFRFERRYARAPDRREVLDCTRAP